MDEKSHAKQALVYIIASSYILLIAKYWQIVPSDEKMGVLHILGASIVFSDVAKWGNIFM